MLLAPSKQHRVTLGHLPNWKYLGSSALFFGLLLTVEDFDPIPLQSRKNSLFFRMANKEKNESISECLFPAVSWEEHFYRHQAVLPAVANFPSIETEVCLKEARAVLAPRTLFCLSCVLPGPHAMGQALELFVLLTFLQLVSKNVVVRGQHGAECTL